MGGGCLLTLRVLIGLCKTVPVRGLGQRCGYGVQASMMTEGKVEEACEK